MPHYIYLSFSDLSENSQEEVKDLAREEVEKETTQQDADDLNMDLEDLILERIDSKLQEMNNADRFVFNI